MCNKNGYRGIYKCVTDDNKDTKYSRTNYMTTPEYVQQEWVQRYIQMYDMIIMTRNTAVQTI